MKLIQRFIGAWAILAIAATCSAQAQYGAAPGLTSASGLVVSYSSGVLPTTQVSIPAGSVTVADAQTNCAWPGFAACNFVYYTSGASLSTTTNPSLALQPGNVLVGLVTTLGGTVTNLISPVSLFSTVISTQWAVSAFSTATATTQSQAYGAPALLPLCTALVKTNCALPSTALSGR